VDQRIIDAINMCIKNKKKNDIEISYETDLRNDLELDSLDYILLINEIEARFNINIDDKNIADIKTVGDIIEKLRGSDKC